MTHRIPQKERVFLIVVDDSPEMQIALRFASLRAKNSNSRIALLYVTEPAEFQHWMFVGSLMQEEAREKAEAVTHALSAKVHEWTGYYPMVYIREGDRAEEVLKLLDEEPSISILMLGASESRKGPGPLVAKLAGKMAGALPVPITVVPGGLEEKDLLAIV